MTKKEAIAAMEAGKKVTHEYFQPNEWITITGGMIVTEDKCEVTQEQFWRDKPSEFFNHNWSLVNEEPQLHKNMIDGQFYTKLNDDEWKPLYFQNTYQDQVSNWVIKCFGETIAKDVQERNHRFFEEATELVQATGITQSECHQLVDYVFNRPVGEVHQEIGGVMVTLAALCAAVDKEMDTEGRKELERVFGKIEEIRLKQSQKPKHSPLPVQLEISDKFKADYYEEKIEMLNRIATERDKDIEQLKTINTRLENCFKIVATQLNEATGITAIDKPQFPADRSTKGMDTV